MTDEQIKYLVNRFLNYKIRGEDFRPDGGVTAKRPNYAPAVEWAIYGTNLLDANQADAMVRYMIEGIPNS